MKKNKNAFTMIEMIFVIVILGILAAIAVPKMAATRTDAEITKGRADIASIRSAIVTERQGMLIQGINTYIPKLSTGVTTLFTGDGIRTLLMYGITAGGTASGKWAATDANGMNYTFTIQTTVVTFTYDSNSGIFTCDTANVTTGTMCATLIN